MGQVNKVSGQFSTNTAPKASEGSKISALKGIAPYTPYAIALTAIPLIGWKIALGGFALYHAGRWFKTWIKSPSKAGSDTAKASKAAAKSLSSPSAPPPSPSMANREQLFRAPPKLASISEEAPEEAQELPAATFSSSSAKEAPAAASSSSSSSAPRQTVTPSFERNLPGAGIPSRAEKNPPPPQNPPPSRDVPASSDEAPSVLVSESYSNVNLSARGLFWKHLTFPKRLLCVNLFKAFGALFYVAAYKRLAKKMDFDTALSRAAILRWIGHGIGAVLGLITVLVSIGQAIYFAFQKKEILEEAGRQAEAMARPNAARRPHPESSLRRSDRARPRFDRNPVQRKSGDLGS